MQRVRRASRTSGDQRAEAQIRLQFRAGIHPKWVRISAASRYPHLDWECRFVNIPEIIMLAGLGLIVVADWWGAMNA